MNIIKYFIPSSYIENPNKQVKNIVYVSLFGKEHYKEVLEEITLKAYKHNKILYFIRNITFWKLSIGAFLQLFIEKNFENIIVCLDDLERKSDKLDIKDILGLVNKLKEEKCKVVLISNEDEISNKEKDKEIFNTYKEKCIDLNIYIRSKEKVVLQILEEKNPEIPENIIPDLIYKIKNLRNLNKIIKALEFFSKELHFSTKLKQKKEYECFFKTISEKIILKYENLNLNKEKQEGIPLEHIFLKAISDMIEDYVNGSIYSISDGKKMDFEKELNNYKFYIDLYELRGLLECSIKKPNENIKEKFEKFFNDFDEKQLNEFVYELGFINFIALDKVCNFEKNEKIIEMKKYCLELASSNDFSEKIINMICDSNEVLRQHYKKLKAKKVPFRSNNTLGKRLNMNKNDYIGIKNFSDFLAHLEKINKFSKEKINDFLDNRMMFSYCDIYFNLEEDNKNKYLSLYGVYESIKSEKSQTKTL